MQPQGNYSNLQLIKKNILYDALTYNLREQHTKQIKKKLEREKQIEEFQMINRRVSTELNEENQGKRKRKQYLKDILSHEYDRQIQQKNILKKEEVRQNRSFAKIQEDYYKDFQGKRARDLTRILKAQRTANIINPEYEQHISVDISRENSRIAIQTNDLADRAHYADYLKQQIQRKRLQKEKEKRQKEQEGHILAQRNSDALTRELEQQRKYHLRQKMAMRKNLDEQIYEKHHSLHRNF